MLLMEMMRQLTHLHEHVWQKKSATSNLPIIVGEYQCRAWVDVNSMIEKLGRYNFNKMPAASHYDPEHKIRGFYMKERKRVYEHRPLRDEEPFQNVSNEVEIRKIRAKIQEEAQKQRQAVEATIDKRLSHSRGRRSQESTSRVTQFPPMIKEPIGQYASMHDKKPVEEVVQQVRDTVDEHDIRELEHVATDKMVRCVRNREEDPSPPRRPLRRTTSRPSQTVPPSGSESFGPLYEPDNSLEGEWEDERENGDHENELEEGEYESLPGEETEEEPENEHTTSTGPHAEIPDAQKDDESLEILKLVHKHAPSKPSTSQTKGKDPTPKSIPRRTQLKRGSQSRLLVVLGEVAEEEGRSSKRIKENAITSVETVVETHQPSPNHEWGVDMDERLDVFNMDVGEDFGAREANDQIRESSTRLGKSQTYVHMTDNAVYIKTLVVDKDNPQCLGELKQINQIINTGPIGVTGRKHAIISSTEAITKDGLLKEKEIKSLKKELAA